MRKRLGLAGLGVAAVVILMVFAAVPTQGDFWTEHSGHCHIGEDCGVDLIAGKNTVAGKVEVTFDLDGLHVEYVATSPWTITETHLLVLSEEPPLEDSDYFNKNGNPKVGHFPYTGELSYDILWSDIEGFDWCKPIYIIAHCVVSKTVNGKTTEETGYGECKGCFKHWAMYFTCTPCKYKTFEIPTGEWRFKAGYVYPNAGAKSYWQMTFDNDPFPWDNDGKIYNSWCVDNNNMDYLSSGSYYTATLISSYNSDNFPTGDVGGLRFNNEWDKINWILNHKTKDDGAPYSTKAIQEAIWYFTDSKEPTTQDGKDLRDDANTFGHDYYPEVGGLLAVILYVPGYYNEPNNWLHQLTIIEVDP